MFKVERQKYEDIGQGLHDQLVAIRDANDIYDNPFFDLNFAGLVSNVRKDTEILIITHNDQPIGYWAMHVRPDKWCRPLGGPFSDWHGPVLAIVPDLPNAANLLELAGLRGMSAHGLQPVGQRQSCGGDIVAVGIAHIPDTAEAYLARQKSLFPKHAKNMRRARRLIERDFESMELTIEDETRASFDWILSTKQAQYKRTGLHNVLGPDWVQEMMERLRVARFPRLWARVSTLKFGGQMAAGEFNLLSDKVVHGWITVYDMQFRNYSPGHVLMQSIICDMVNTGHTMCDVGTGNHEYKKFYESFQLPLEAMTLCNGTGPRGMSVGWRFLEQNIAPERLASIMQSARRRGDQVFSSELDVPSRLKGLAQAARRLVPARTSQ